MLTGRSRPLVRVRMWGCSGGEQARAGVDAAAQGAAQAAPVQGQDHACDLAGVQGQGARQEPEAVSESQVGNGDKRRLKIQRRS